MHSSPLILITFLTLDLKGLIKFADKKDRNNTPVLIKQSIEECDSKNTIVTEIEYF